jgi:hypothetical protein
MRCSRALLAYVVATTVAACGSASSEPSTTSTATLDPPVSEPAQAEFISSDILHFWQAYDQGGAAGSADAFQRIYLDQASAGLRDFIGKRDVTAASIVSVVRAYPKYFGGIRAGMLSLASTSVTSDRIRAGFAKLKALYPAAMFPPTVFLVGRFSTGGTTSANGLLIGAEFYSGDAATPRGELGAFQQANVASLDSLPFIVAHENIHAQQANAGSIHGSGSSLLAQSIMEGSADFLGELTSGGIINGKIHQWALPREPALWAEFKSVMHSSDVSRWLYNQGSSTATADRPGDLGYFIGYRIAKAYYDKQTDKAAAVGGIIKATDADAFLAASGYDPR